MISLTAYRKNVFQIFDIQKKTGMTVKVYHRRKVYDVIIKPTYDKVEIPYAQRPGGKKKGVNPHTFQYTDCQCGSTLVNGICMNKKCDINGLYQGLSAVPDQSS